MQSNERMMIALWFAFSAEIIGAFEVKMKWMRG